MRIFITGDLHGSLDVRKFNSKNFPEGCNLTKEDLVIICGDFGLYWFHNDEELHWRNWLSNKPWTTLFIDGNHDNIPELVALPEIDMFGSKVGKINDDIFYLKRGEIYTINDKTFFCMGGAYSIDKDTNPHRIPGVGWFPEEIPSYKEFEHGLDNLEKSNWTVDYILGHTAPKSILHTYLNSMNFRMYDSADKLDTVSKYFDTVVEKTNFKKMFFGHMHDNWKFEKYQMLYEDVYELED